MEGICPKCHVRLELPTSGVYDCERCRARFEVALGAPRAVGVGAAWGGAPSSPGWAPAVEGGAGTQGWTSSAAGREGTTLDPGVPAPCAYHAGNPASHLCERCGDFMCGLCKTPVEGRAYCPRCFDLLYSRGALQLSQRQFTLPGITLGLGISAVLMSCACVGVPFGIGGIVAAASALKELRRRPDLPGRRATLWGLGLSVTSLVITAVTVTVFVVKVLNA